MRPRPASKPGRRITVPSMRENFRGDGARADRGPRLTTPLQIVRSPDARAAEIAQELAYQNDVGGLKMVVVAEPEQVLLRHDQARLFLGEDALLLQARNAT